MSNMKPILVLVAFATGVVSGPGVVVGGASSSGTGLPEVQGAQPMDSGCCDGAGQGEFEIDILDIEYLDEGELVGSQLQNDYSVVFPDATIEPAPNGPLAYIVQDDARPDECDGLHNWAISGEPTFPDEGDGDEVFQFLGPGDVPMVVNRVSVSVGFLNGFFTTMSVYDIDGEFLEDIENGLEEGFEEMTIDRSWTDPDIHYVVISAPLDPQGVGINCIRYPIPVPAEPPTPTESATWGRVKGLYRSES